LVIIMARPIKPPEARNTAVNISLPLGLLVRIDEAANQAGLSRSEFLRSIAERALEDADDMAVARARLADDADGWVSLGELPGGVPGG
jgi:predicted DNA-binding protein